MTLGQEYLNVWQPEFCMGFKSYHNCEMEPFNDHFCDVWYKTTQLSVILLQIVDGQSEGGT